MFSVKVKMNQHEKIVFKIKPILSLLVISFLPGIMFSSPSIAAIKKGNVRRFKTIAPPAPLIDKATLEIQKIQERKPPPTTKTSTSSGIFTVQEPAFKITERNWKYLLGLKVQSLKPAGIFQSSIVGDFDLNAHPSQIFPTLELGLGKNYATLTPWSEWSVLAQLGYSSAQVPVTFQSGYKAPVNTRLNMMKTNIGIETQRIIAPHFPGSYKVGLALGKFFYSQTSLNDLAQFSESFLFGAMNLGATYSWWESMSLSVDYIFRQPLQSSPLQLQTHNLELGLRVQW